MQINVTIPDDWKEELERLARIQSVEEDKTLTYLDLIRKSVSERYGLEYGKE